MRKILFISLLIVGCTAPKLVTETITEVKEVLRDTVIQLPADSAAIKALIECDSLGNARLVAISELRKSLSVKPSVKLLDNYIYLECQVDSMKVYLSWKERHERKTTLNKVIITEKPKGFINRYPKLSVVCASIITLLSVIIILKVFRAIKA